MDRMSAKRQTIDLEAATQMFQRSLANWAGDLLRQSQIIAWPKPQAANDFRDRNWKKMYEGSVVDD